MAKKTSQQDQINALAAKVAAKDQALSEARKGLFRIIGLDPASYQVTPGKGLKIVKAFEEAKSVAQRTLIAVSDADAEAADA